MTPIQWYMLSDEWFALSEEQDRRNLITPAENSERWARHMLDIARWILTNCLVESDQ
jgi:hypothetical protein